MKIGFSGVYPALSLRRWVVFNALLLIVSPTWAREDATATTGPVIPSFGPVYQVSEEAFNLQEGRHYKVSKDVAMTADDPARRNPHIESAARFLNMQVRTGTKPDQLEMAMIVHGGASRDLLTDAQYRSRFGVANPNTGLLDELAAAGVRVYLCGQTAAHRGLSADMLNPAVTMALSAMTAHVQLQSEGFTLIPF